jgi:hypothetical protein
MAFLVAAESASSAAAATYTQPIPAGHQQNDLLLAAIYQDGGATAFSALPSGWAFLSSPAQAAENAQRTHFAWKIAANSSEADFSVTGATEEWGVTIMVWRGVNTSTPFHGTAIRTSIAASAAPASSGSYTTSTSNVTVLYVLGYDGTDRRGMPATPSDLTFVSKLDCEAAGFLGIGYRNQISAGTAPAVTFRVNNSDGGSFWVLGIADDGNGNMGPDSRQTYEVVAYHGEYASAHDTGITWNALTGITGLVGQTIDGIGIDTTAPTTLSITSTVSSEWNRNESSSVEALSNLSFSNSLGSDAWVGGSYLLPSTTDMSNRLLHVRITYSNFASPLGDKGFIVVLEDTGGGWAAFRVSVKSGLSSIANSSTAAIIDLQNWTPLASAGTMNWNSIRRIGYGMHRVAGSTGTRTIGPKDIFLLPKAIMVGGSANSPCSAAALEPMLRGWSDEPLMFALQGAGQGLSRGSVQFGDGSAKTYVDAKATSFEYPRPFNASVARRSWQVAEGTNELRIRAASTDTVRYSTAVAATSSRQRFIIDSTSSASATYDFSGLALVGWSVENNVSGVAFNEVTFSGCYTITLNGGSMSGCTVGGSLATSAVVTNNPANISNCHFDQGSAGHAIEITSPGTYTFAGNVFDGYGTAGSTDAAIYNNSGGTVTLNITGGGSTPTVRNGASASTTINNNITLTLNNVVVGSAIRIEKVSDGSLVEFRVADATTEAFAVAASNNYRVKVRKGTAAQKYLPFETQTGTVTLDTPIFVSQIPDTIAA